MEGGNEDLNVVLVSMNSDVTNPISDCNNQLILIWKLE